MTSRTARLQPMAAADVAAWRAERIAAGRGFPDAPTGDRTDVVEVVVDDVAIGGAVLVHTVTDGAPRSALRLLQTTVPPEALDVWTAVAGALEARAREAGSRSLVTAVPVRLGPAFQAAGFGATMTRFSVAIDPAAPPRTPEDLRFALRPMTDDERRTFARDALAFTREGMERSGVLTGPGAPMPGIEERLTQLADDPPASEVLMVATVDGEPAGRFWATQVPAAEPTLVSNTLDLLPAFRGRGLTLAFLSAIERHARATGIRRYEGLHYGHDDDARRTLLRFGAELTELHLRKDLV